jgi:small nuclear ribonucleoprotein (snRNP)-like protein
MTPNPTPINKLEDKIKEVEIKVLHRNGSQQSFQLVAFPEAIDAINNIILEEVLELIGEDEQVRQYGSKMNVEAHWRNNIRAELRRAATKKWGRE